jgi:hypothetical protein
MPANLAFLFTTADGKDNACTFRGVYSLAKLVAKLRKKLSDTELKIEDCEVWIDEGWIDLTDVKLSNLPAKGGKIRAKDQEDNPANDGVPQSAVKQRGRSKTPPRRPPTEVRPPGVPKELKLILVVIVFMLSSDTGSGAWQANPGEPLRLAAARGALMPIAFFAIPLYAAIAILGSLSEGEIGGVILLVLVSSNIGGKHSADDSNSPPPTPPAPPPDYCSVFGDNPPPLCDCSNNLGGVTLNCALNLPLGNTIMADVDIRPCNANGAQVGLWIEHGTGGGAKFGPYKAGAKIDKVQVPGLNIELPGIGTIGGTVSVAIMGTHGNLKLELLVDACGELPLLGNKCASDMLSAFPVQIISKDIDFSHMCDGFKPTQQQIADENGERASLEWRREMSQFVAETERGHLSEYEMRNRMHRIESNQKMRRMGHDMSSDDFAALERLANELF